MKINIKPSNCKFVINEEKRKVVCIIDDTESLVLDFLGFPWDNKIPIKNDVADMLIMPNHFTGVATCAPEDKWDPEIGKAIAFSRAKFKVNSSFFKRANTLVNEIDRRLGEMVLSFNDYGRCLDANNKKREKWITERVGNDVFLGDHRESEVVEL